MAEPEELSLFDLPDDMLREISEYCDLPTRCAVTCTNSTALNSVLLGSVALSKDGSERFLKENRFRLRICRRVVTPSRNLHLQVQIKEIEKEAHVEIMNSVHSVFLYPIFDEYSPAWVNQLPRIQTLTKLS